MDLRKAQKEIERLQDQLEKAYGRHSRPSNPVTRGFVRKSANNNSSLASSEQANPFSFAPNEVTFENQDPDVNYEHFELPA